MNYRLLCKLLGYIALLIGCAMLFSLPWAFPSLGYRKQGPQPIPFELAGFVGLLASMLICLAVAALLLWIGRHDTGKLFRKEAMAVVGLSWVMATVLGGLPFYLAGVRRCQAVRLSGNGFPPLIARDYVLRKSWDAVPVLDSETFHAVAALTRVKSEGLSEQELRIETDNPEAPQLLERLVASHPLWKAALHVPDPDGTDPGAANFRIRYLRMGIADALFESQSGFSTTGATVLAELEDPRLVPHCILFWRSSTHFLGGLGIIVLFVVILGQGSTGKAMMRAEMPGPTKEGATARMQHTAWLFAATYCLLNLVLAILLWLQGMSVFDALCHAFGTMATGGFSTYNASLGHFNSPIIDYTVVLFMILAGSNFTLLFLALTAGPARILADTEWQVYMLIITVLTALIVVFGLVYGDFRSVSEAVRFGLFQVVSVITTTGYGTHDFDAWNHFARGSLFLLMFVGGCAGSTGGGLKVIRHVLFIKILRLEIEHSFHPNVVRPLRLGGRPVEDPALRKSILVYFGLITVIFVGSWLFVVTVEPDNIWGDMLTNKLVDSASAIAATLNNIGPGLGTVGATQNYTHFSPLAKLLFVWLMMLGRLELFSILVLVFPSFWRNR